MPYEELDTAGAVLISGGPYGAPLTGETDRKTLEEMQEWLAKRLGTRDDVETSELTAWLNGAIRELSFSLELDELKSSLTFDTEAGEILYELPVGVGGLLQASAVVQATPEWGGRIEIWQMERWRNARQFEGSILSVTRWTKYLLVYPEPSQAETVTLDFMVHPQPLVSAAQQTPLHPKWERAILLLAQAHALSDLNEPESAGLKYNEYLRTVREMRSAAADNRKGSVMAVSVPRNARDLYRGVGRD